MFFRAIALSLALLVGIGSIIPFINDTAEAGPKYKKKKKKKLKKYSKAWWLWYRKEQRKKRAIFARKRALRAKQILLARQRAQRAKKAVPVKKVEKVSDNIQAKNTKPAKIANESQPKDSELQFRVKDDSGKALGTATLSVLMESADTDSSPKLNKIGGVPTSLLRRNVVDKMVKEDGWVVNDYQKVINGKNVYIVIAQSPVKGVVHLRLFYFAEVEGRIYSLSTTCPKDAQARVEQESEKLIESLQRGNKIAQVGK